MNQKDNWFKTFSKHFKQNKSFAYITTLACFLVLFVAISASVSRWKQKYIYEKSTFTQWYEKNNEENVEKGYRSIASETPPFACLSDGIRIENLKKDVEFLEAQLDSGKGLKGEWKGMDLETLPTPQAQFILDYSKWIGDYRSNALYDSCKDVICVLNKIYNDQSGLSGYLSYYWYLKTGTMLSVSNNLPKSSKNNVPLREFLFTQGELKNFWKLAKSLPQEFLHIPGLRTIHKVPTVVSIEGENNKKFSISLGTGQLMFKSECISNSTDNFFKIVSSTMAKHVDLNKGKNSYSMDESWIALSQWSHEEYWFDQYQTYAQSWTSGMPENYFSSKYSSTHPTRQFAESLSLFRYDPVKFSSLSDDFKNYVSQNFFNHYDYTANGLLEKYLAEADSLWEKEESEYWSKCLDRYFTIEHIDQVGKDKKEITSVNSNLFNCMDKKIPGFVAKVLTKIKKDQYEGCDFFNLEKYQDHADKFIELLSKSINKKIFKAHFDLEKWGVEFLIGLKVKQQVQKKFDPTSLYVSCTQKFDSEQCYNNKLSVIAKVHLEQFKGVSSEYHKMIHKQLMHKYNYRDIKEYSENKIKKFLFPYYADLKVKSLNLWESCKERKLSDTEELDYPMFYNGGGHYVHPTFLNCLNDDAESIVSEVLSKPLELGADSEYEFELKGFEKEYATKIMNKRMVQNLNEYLYESYQKEKDFMISYFVENRNDLVEEVISTEGFLSEVYSNLQMRNRCLDTLGAKYPHQYQFHTSAQLTGEYGNKICDAILEKDQIKRTVASKINAQWNDHKDMVAKDYKETYQGIIDNCYDRYPSKLSINFVKNSKLRKDCLEEGHETALNEVLERWKEKEDSKHFINKESALKAELHSLKESIISNMRKSERVISQ